MGNMSILVLVDGKHVHLSYGWLMVVGCLMSSFVWGFALSAIQQPGTGSRLLVRDMPRCCTT